MAFRQTVFVYYAIILTAFFDRLQFSMAQERNLVKDIKSTIASAFNQTIIEDYNLPMALLSPTFLIRTINFAYFAINKENRTSTLDANSCTTFYIWEFILSYLHFGIIVFIYEYLYPAQYPQEIRDKKIKQWLQYHVLFVTMFSLYVITETLLMNISLKLLVVVTTANAVNLASLYAALKTMYAGSVSEILDTIHFSDIPEERPALDA